MKECNNNDNVDFGISDHMHWIIVCFPFTILDDDDDVITDRPDPPHISVWNIKQYNFDQ